MIPRLAVRRLVAGDEGSDRGLVPATSSPSSTRHLATRPYLFGERPAFADFGLYAQLYRVLDRPDARARSCATRRRTSCRLDPGDARPARRGRLRAAGTRSSTDADAAAARRGRRRLLPVDARPTRRRWRAGDKEIHRHARRQAVHAGNAEVPRQVAGGAGRPATPPWPTSRTATPASDTPSVGSGCSKVERG